MADDVVRDPPGAIWRKQIEPLIKNWRAIANDAKPSPDDDRDLEVMARDAQYAETLHLCANDLEKALRACADDLETAPSPQNGEATNEEASRVGGVPGVGHGDLSRKDRNGVVSAPPKHIVDFAVEIAGWSPCQSKRGVVIFRGDDILTHGHNYKPRGFDCDGSDACKSTCRVEAVHAEQQALLTASFGAAGADLLHVKAVNGQLVPSGGPSCVQCSKLALVAGIAAVWLYHESGWQRYDIKEFHALSLRAAALDAAPSNQQETAAMTERLMTPQLQEWEDAVNAATTDALNPHAIRMESAGRVLARDYVKLLERANAEASLAVRLPARNSKRSPGRRLRAASYER